MKPVSTPTAGFYHVTSRANATRGQKLPTWGIKFTLPSDFPEALLTVDDFTWTRGRFMTRDLFRGEDTPANAKRAHKDSIVLIANLKHAVENPVTEPPRAVTWGDAWAGYAKLNNAEKPNGRGQTRMFFTRWQCIAPYVRDIPIVDVNAKGEKLHTLRDYLEELLSEDDPSPRMFRGRNGRPDFEVRKPMTRASMEGYQTLLKALAYWAFKRDLIKITDIPAFDFTAKSNRREETWTWEQMRALWDAAPSWKGRGSYIHRFTWILLSSGARRGRVEHAKWECLENDNHLSWERCGGPGKAVESYFNFDKSYVMTGKDNKRASRQKIAHPDVLALLAEAFENREPGNPYVLGQLKTANAEFGAFVRTVAAARPELAIPVLSPHHARHSLATHMLSTGWPTADVAAFLGCTIGILERHYHHVIKEHTRDAAAFVAKQYGAVPVELAKAAE